MKILVVEDDHETATYLKASLSGAEHFVDCASDGSSGLRMASNGDYDLLVVDRMLPHTDGISLIRNLRAEGKRMPVLMLSALSEADYRVEGLDAGADDYLGKPFALNELKARVGALARRPPLAEARTRWSVADLHMDLISREVTRGQHVIELQPREFRLLEYLMMQAGKVVTRSMLLEHVWEFHFDPQTSIVETHISRLRGKIDRGYDVPLLQTIRGSGYCLRAPG
ncbi:response regulator transcription factor [Dyella sp.]|jgi:two-component system OmpR family response regulator|uniref:response regulator transcription factor n=1 Tax=Dyella sp. TaxID=1869338 RepID=UPI002BA1B179|nr:response regulator transcription factor [Dyella sp.]HTC29008.1 response regulator transcription factor [Dyella sp.]